MFEESSSFLGSRAIPNLSDGVLLRGVGRGQKHLYAMLGEEVLECLRGILTPIVVDKGFNF